MRNGLSCFTKLQPASSIKCRRKQLSFTAFCKFGLPLLKLMITLSKKAKISPIIFQRFVILIFLSLIYSLEISHLYLLSRAHICGLNQQHPDCHVDPVDFTREYFIANTKYTGKLIIYK